MISGLPADVTEANASNSAAPSQPRRKMERSELLGQHSHQTAAGVNVHVFIRDGVYLARGRYESQAFGETLDSDQVAAGQKLRRLLGQIDDGVYVRSSDRAKQQLRWGAPPKLDVSGLCNRYLTEKRSVVGKKTTQDYTSRLSHLIAYAEQPEVRRRWHTAATADRNFVVGFRSFLAQRQVTRNGRSAGAAQPMSPGYMWQVLDCGRTMFAWAQKPTVNLLSAAMNNPFTADLVGPKPRKDPCRPVTFPLPTRVALVGAMDAWQLLHLTWALVLPLRPEDFAGLLIEDIDEARGCFRFGSRFGGADFNKGRQEYVCPYPAELAGLLDLCRGGRGAGPLLRCRAVFQAERSSQLNVETPADVVRHIEAELRDAPAGELKAPQDSKLLVRACIRKMGGVNDDSVAKEWQRLFAGVASGSRQRRYDLRGSVSTELNAAGVSLLVQRYVTGHSTNDIMNHYVSLDPAGEMRRYFDTLGPLFEAIDRRGRELGLSLAKPGAEVSQPREIVQDRRALGGGVGLPASSEYIAGSRPAG